MSPAPHADRDHSEAPETDQWRSNYATLCRALVLAKRDSEAAEAERDRARSLAATLEARLVEAEVTLWDHPDCIGECACAKNAARR